MRHALVGHVRACRAFGPMGARLPVPDKELFCPRCLPERIRHKGPVIHAVTGPFRREKARSNRAVLPDQQPILSTPPDRITGPQHTPNKANCAACICDFHYSFRRTSAPDAQKVQNGCKRQRTQANASGQQAAVYWITCSSVANPGSPPGLVYPPRSRTHATGVLDQGKFCSGTGRAASNRCTFAIHNRR